jgi:hypothetical protein
MLTAWLMMVLAVPAQTGQEYTIAGDGSAILLPGGAAFEVIRDDTTVSGQGVQLSYYVEGVRLTSGEMADTLFWLAQQPARAISAAIASGRRRLFERRSLRLLTYSGSHIGGEMKVLSGATRQDASLFTVFRTWLSDGTPLELESVVQLDSRFNRMVSRLADLPSGSLDQGLIASGHWLDPRSFLVLEEEDGPVLRLGLPSWDDEGTMLVLDIPFDSLNTASGAMLD